MAFDYRLTRYQPSYTYGGVRYETEAAPQTKSPVLAKMEQEEQAARQEREYKRQAGDSSAFLPGYLNLGLVEDISKMKALAANGDMQGAMGIRDKISGYADEYRTALVAWSQNGGLGGEFGRKMASQAEAVLYGTYLDDTTLSVGKGGQVTLRDFFSNSSPEAKTAAADAMSRKYGVSADAAMVLSDQDNPFYSVFNGMRVDYATGLEMQANKNTRLSGDDKVSQAESAMQLYSEHLADNMDKWGDTDQKAVGNFYSQAYQYFGSDLSTAQVDTLMRQYQRDMEDPSFNSRRWFQSRRSAIDSNVPKDVRPEPVVENGKVVGFRQTEYPDPTADRYQVLDTALQVSDFLQSSSVGTSTDTIEQAAGVKISQQHALERDLGIRLADYGGANAAAMSAAHSLYEGYASEDGGHLYLDQLQSFVDSARQTLGYDGRRSRDPGARMGMMTDDIVSSVSKAYLQLRPSLVDGAYADSTGRLAPELATALQQAVVSSLQKSASRYMVPMNDEFAQAFAARFIENLSGGRPQSMQTMLLDLAGRLKFDPQTGAAELQPSGSYVDPRTGATVTGNVDPNVDPGLMGTDPAKVKTASPQEFHAAMQALSDIETGKAPHLSGRPEADAVRTMARQLRQSHERVISGGATGGSTESMQPAAGKVFYSNLKAAGAELGSTTRGFLESGELFRFVEGRDKTTGWTDGDPALRGRAMDTVNELASVLISAEASTESKVVAGELFARLSVELLNRGGWGDKGARYFNETSRNLLTRLGVPEAERFWQNAPSVGGPGRWTRKPHGDMSDGDAQRAYQQLRKALSQTLGYNIAEGNGAVARSGGYVFPELGAKAPVNYNYGRIFSTWDARTRPEPPLASTPSQALTTPEVVGSTEMAAIPDPAALIRQGADHMLRSTLSRDSAVDLLTARFKDFVKTSSSTPEETAAYVERMVPEIERIYDHEGFEAADRMVMGQLARERVYLRVPQLGADGKPIYDKGVLQTRIRDELMTPDQVYATASNLGVTVGELKDLSNKYRRDLDHRMSLEEKAWYGGLLREMQNQADAATKDT